MNQGNWVKAQADNVLLGTEEAIKLGADCYALSYSSANGVGFYLWEDRSIAANKAYLHLGGAQ